MRFLSVADRELRAAARHKTTYRARWLTAGLFFALLVWLLWVSHGFANPGAAPRIFTVYSVCTFLYCLFISTARTADCISVERREGTLGLLFLTNLNSAEIIAGKLCSSALASVYGLMAIFPMLALPLLMGGTSFGHFARTVVALLSGILSALAAGFLASVVCQRQIIAIALGLGLTACLSGGLMLGAAVADSYARTRPLASWLVVFSPLYTLIAADNTRVLGANRFWLSVVAVATMAFSGLGLTTLLLARTWRDQPKRVRWWNRPAFWRRSERAPSAKRAALRRRLLAINPMFWLAARQPVSAPVFMLLAVVLTALTVNVTGPYFGRVMVGGAVSPVIGQTFAWLWTGLLIHGLVLYYGATTAAQRLAEDKESGALELILSTPLTERTLARGLWLAYGRKMLFPALLAVLVHCFFIWMLLVLMTLEPPGRVTLVATPGELFWSALVGQPLRGRALDWQFGFILRIPMLILLLLMATWPTLGWVGRWLGVRMKHPGFATITSLALLFAPPILLFSLACYLADNFGIYRLSERQFLPMMMWLAFAIGIAHCLLLSLWAASRLRHHLRPVAMSRYQPLPPWRWRFPSRRTVQRWALAGVGSAAVLALLVASYYGYQNWRSRRAWRTFQTVLTQSGASLNLAPLMPEPAPEEANFVRSPAFSNLLRTTNRGPASLYERLRPFEQPLNVNQGNPVLLEWGRQTNAPLLFVSWSQHNSKNRSGTTRTQEADAILQGLKSQSVKLQELALAAARLPIFQTSTNRDAGAVLGPVREEVLLLERLHLLFQVRACASLTLGRKADAAEDVLTGLRLARLARQFPDARSTLRVQGLLARSLQPVWEGLSQQAWTEPQLSALQRELAGFDLIADYTNTVHRVVLAHIEVWRAIPDSTNAQVSLPVADGGYRHEPAWQLQPRAWWYDSCILLHNIGRTMLEQVDVAAGRVQPADNWSDLRGLPLDSPSLEILQQAAWLQANPACLAFVQTSVHQATVACALERYRLVNRTYPETLDPLAPALLARVPHDAVSGRPLIYQPDGAGSFILRGVGPNGADDRKKMASDDWLWTYSTNRPSAKQ